MRRLRLNHIELLRYAGLFTYACVGIPLVFLSPVDLQVTKPGAHVGWWVSYLVFGISYWTLTHDLGRPRPALVRVPLLLVLTVSWAAIGYFSESGLPGILLLVLAGVLPWILPLHWAVLWLVVDTLVLIPVFALSVPGYNWFAATLQCGLYAGFTAVTFATSLVAKEQADAREEQRRLNAELRATRALLAESSRMAERVRISRELHDLLGHHLTALTLNLEVASHLVADKALEHVRQSQSLAKLLLTDVREVVSQLRTDDEIDLTQALKSLVEGIPEPRIHLDIPPRLGVDDPRRAQVVLRCTQEIVTNAMRHAGARNLWLSFDRNESNELTVRARDDGQGAVTVSHGHGLTGMRERLAQFGGSLKVDTGKGQGFALEALLPLEDKP